MGKPINPCGIYSSVLWLKNKAAGLAVSAPVAHGGEPQDRAGKSLGATVRPERGSASEAGAMFRGAT